MEHKDFDINTQYSTRIYKFWRSRFSSYKLQSGENNSKSCLQSLLKRKGTVLLLKLTGDRIITIWSIVAKTEIMELRCDFIELFDERIFPYSLGVVLSNGSYERCNLFYRQTKYEYMQNFDLHKN